MLAKNPNIRVRKTGRGEQAECAIAGTSAQKHPKYLNYKVFIHEKGISIKKRDDSLGKLLEQYDSMKEYQRYKELLLLQRHGDISSLSRQETLVIQEGFSYNGSKVSPITYKADFTYDTNDGKHVVEDVKAFDEVTGKHRTTKDFDLKWKMLKFQHRDWSFKIY